MFASQALPQDECVLRPNRKDQRKAKPEPGQDGSQQGGKHSNNARAFVRTSRTNFSTGALELLTMELPQLQALAAVVDTGSFEAAARALHVTPSAISQRIRSLENSAGGVLLQRSRPIATTSAGAAYLRLARQIEVLTVEAAAAAGLATGSTEQSSNAPATRPHIPLAINGDSLASWVVPALAHLAQDVSFDIHRQDQDHSAQLLRDGTVMAAVTTESHPVQGCTVTRLGVMRYRAVAAPKFMDRWFRNGITNDSLAAAPMVVFDRKDELQDQYLRTVAGASLQPPRHYVPVSSDFVAAVRLGFGWAMVPDQQSSELLARGELEVLPAGKPMGVTLYWQQWALRTNTLDRVTAAITTAAARELQ